MAFALAAGAGAAATVIAQQLMRKLKIKTSGNKGDNIQERSTTSSAGGGAAAYDTKKAVDGAPPKHPAATQYIHLNSPSMHPPAYASWIPNLKPSVFPAAEYLQFHYAAPEDLLPYANGPKVTRQMTSKTESHTPYSWLSFLQPVTPFRSPFIAAETLHVSITPLSLLGNF